MRGEGKHEAYKMIRGTGNVCTIRGIKRQATFSLGHGPTRVACCPTVTSARKRAWQREVISSKKMRRAKLYECCVYFYLTFICLTLRKDGVIRPCVPAPCARRELSDSHCNQRKTKQPRP